METKRKGVDTHDVRKPDAQGRIIIGKQFADETFQVQMQDNGDILLTPVMVIPKRETWLLANPEAMEAVKKGLKEASEGKLVDLGSFSDRSPDCEGED